MRAIPLILLASLFTTPALVAAEKPNAAPLIEQSIPLKGGKGLGTTGYQATTKESPFAKRVTEKPIDLSSAVEMPKATNMSDAEWAKLQAEEKAARAKLIPIAAYKLSGQTGEYVGWFGLVRSITLNEKTHQNELVVQHLYFDGLTDLHLQVVSYYGAGDFTVVVPDQAPGITKLALVRCYGRVGNGAGDIPVVASDYIRTWAWGQFTFMDYGVDKSNPEWVRLRQVKGEDAYSARPDRQFYIQRLGSPD